MNQQDLTGQLATARPALPPGWAKRGGFRVIEVWESQEALQEFFAQKLGQALQQASITTQPKFFQVINTMQP